MLPNLPQFVIAFFGALKLGAIVVNTNPTYTAREIEHQFADSGCETVVLLSAFYDRLKEVQDHTQVKRVIIADVPDYVPAPGECAGQAHAQEARPDGRRAAGQRHLLLQEAAGTAP